MLSIKCKGRPIAEIVGGDDNKEILSVIDVDKENVCCGICSVKAKKENKCCDKCNMCHKKDKKKETISKIKWIPIKKHTKRGIK